MRGQLLHDVHGHLARESDGAGVAPHLQSCSAGEVFADALLDQVDCDALLLRSDDVAATPAWAVAKETTVPVSEA